MNIEDLIISFSQISYSATCLLDSKDRHFITSLCSQIYSGLALTEKQANLAVQILKKHRLLLNTLLKKDISQYLTTPSFRAPFRKLSKEKRLTMSEHPIFKKVIQLESPYSSEFIEKLRNNRPNGSYSEWDQKQRVWNFGVSESNILFLANLVANDSVIIDQEIKILIEQAREIVKNMDQFVPMLILENERPTLKNVSKFTPSIQSENILDALFEARKYGVLTWDEDINDYLNNSNINPITVDFLNNDPGTRFHVNSLNNSIDCLGDIIKRMSPCMVVIPGNDVIEKTTMTFDFFKSIGITTNEMSVTFRLDNSDYGLKFNQFVKDNSLNSPISEKTKIVFVSEKIKKDVIRSKTKYNSVINLGLDGVHYTLVAHLENRPNLITYFAGENKKEKTFWDR